MFITLLSVAAGRGRSPAIYVLPGTLWESPGNFFTDDLASDHGLTVIIIEFLYVDSKESENSSELHCQQQPERVQLPQLHQRSRGGAV
jgi:hypothetical protein